MKGKHERQLELRKRAERGYRSKATADLVLFYHNGQDTEVYLHQVQGCPVLQAESQTAVKGRWSESQGKTRDCALQAGKIEVLSCQL